MMALLLGRSIQGDAGASLRVDEYVMEELSAEVVIEAEGAGGIWRKELEISANLTPNLSPQLLSYHFHMCHRGSHYFIIIIHPAQRIIIPSFYTV